MRDSRRLESRQLLFVVRLVFLVGGSCHLCLAGSVCDNAACDTKDALHCPQKSDMSVAKICSTPSLPPPPPPPLVKFTTEPLNMLYTSSTTTMSAISIDCSIMDSLPRSVRINFLWERDGAIINVTQSQHEEVYQVQSGALSSRLTVANRTGGVYRCRVASQREREEGRYDVVSRAATLSVPTHNGWLDTVHIPPLTQPTNNNQPLKLKIPPGGSTVLECKPNITDPSRPSITWLRNNTPLNDRNEHHTLLPQSYSLILHNFTLPLGTDVATYRCLLDGFEYYEAEIEREFRIRLAGEGDQESGQKFSAVPRTQSVVVGSNMTMYCITNNHTSSSSVKWYKNDVILSDHFTSQGVTNEVLFIQNITLEDAGGYSCVAPSGENMTALLTVLAPPTHATISVSNYTITDGQLCIPNTTHTVSMTMTCNTDATNGIEYEWFFRGDKISKQDFSSKNLTYHSEGNVLHIAGTVESVIGSVQCFARNGDIAGSNSVSSSLQIVELYVSNKPLPPSNVLYELIHPWKYRIYFSPPTYLTGPFYSTNVSYHVEVYVDTSPTYDHYDYCSTCSDIKNMNSDTGEAIFDLYTVQFVTSVADSVRMYLRVAISVNDVMSDFTSMSDCEEGIDLTLKNPPPPPTTTISHDRNSGNVTLRWEKAEECDYPKDGASLQIFETHVHMVCGDGLDQNVLVQDKMQYNVTHHVDGCVLCNWTVTYTVPNSRSQMLTSSTSRTVNAASSLHAPTLHSAVYDGHSIRFNATFVSSDLTCSNVIVVNSSSTSLSRFDFNDSCHILTQNETTTTRTCVVSYTLEDCRGEHNVSVTLDSNGPFSGVSMVQLPSKDDISTLQHFNASTTTSDSISIDYQLANNMVCLLQQQSGAAAKICCVEKLNCECSAHSSSRCEPQISRDCHDINEEMSLSSVTMEGLKSNTTYCVMAQVSVLSEVKWMDNSLIVVTDEALPTSQTQTSHGDGGGTTSSSQSPKGPNNTVVIALCVGVPVVILVLLVIIIIIAYGCCGSYKTKKKSEERRKLLHSYMDEEICDDDKVSVNGGGPAPSLMRSDVTNWEGLHHYDHMQSYLQDVEQYGGTQDSIKEEEYLVKCDQRKKDDMITEDIEPVVDGAHSEPGAVLADARNSSPSSKSNRFDQFGSNLNHHSVTNSNSKSPTTVSVTVEMENLDEQSLQGEKELLIPHHQKESKLKRIEEQSSRKNYIPNEELAHTYPVRQSSASNSLGCVYVSDLTTPLTETESTSATTTDNSVVFEPVLTSSTTPISSGYVQGPNQEMTPVANPISLQPANGGVGGSCSTQNKQELLHEASLNLPSHYVPLPSPQEPSNAPCSDTSDYIYTEESNTCNAPSSFSSSSYLRPSSPEPLDTSLQYTPNFIQSDNSSSGTSNYVTGENVTQNDTTSQNLSDPSGGGFILGFVQEYNDNSSDSGSQSNSVFADEEGSHFPPRTNQDKYSFSRTRSEVTSGIGSTSSDSPIPSDVVSDYVSSDPHSSSDADESNFTSHTQFHSNTGDNALDNQFVSGTVYAGKLSSSPESPNKSELFRSQMRRQSEGYQSGLPTPVSGSVFDFQEPSFTKRHPLSLPLALSSHSDTNTHTLSTDLLQTPLSSGGDGSSSGYMSESITSRPSILSDLQENTPLASEEESHIMLDPLFDQQTFETVLLSADEEDHQSNDIKFDFPSSIHNSQNLHSSPQLQAADVGDLDLTENQRHDAYANTSEIDVQNIGFQFLDQSSCST